MERWKSFVSSAFLGPGGPRKAIIVPGPDSTGLRNGGLCRLASRRENEMLEGAIV